MFKYILIQPLVRLWRQTIAVVNIVRPSESVVNNHRPLCLQTPVVWY